jgi:hypothetical protein
LLRRGDENIFRGHLNEKEGENILSLNAWVFKCLRTRAELRRDQLKTMMEWRNVLKIRVEPEEEPRSIRASQSRVPLRHHNDAYDYYDRL